MKNLLVMALVCAGVNTLSAQSLEADRFTAGASVVSTFGDYRAFTNRSLGFAVEGTYDVTREPQPLNFRALVGFVRVAGKERADLDTTLSLSGIRAGVDVTFRTPSEQVTPYVGLVFTRWTGKASQTGNLTAEAADFSDKGFKLGFRVGVDVAVTRNIVLAADYNLSEWRHSSDISKRPTWGVNPVNPSWMSVTARYRF